MLNAEDAVRRVEQLATRANEEGLPLSPLLVLGVLDGTVVIPEKPRPLTHDMPRPAMG
jgi:hypothetical protein